MKLTKKKLLILSAVIVLIVLGAAGYKLYQNVTENKIKQVVAERPKEAIKKANKIYKASYSIGLSESPRESEILTVMNQMTHQKIRAKDKYGAIPMIPDTINQVYNTVVAGNFTHKDSLLTILTKWKKGDFSSVDADHNQVLIYQRGTIGEATGLLTPEEEAEFILIHFGDELN